PQQAAAAAGGSRSRGGGGGRSGSSRCTVIVETRRQRILCPGLSQQQLTNGDAFLGIRPKLRRSLLYRCSTRRTSAPYSLCQGHGQTFLLK
ncbi:MAG: hypothetical protein ACK56F_30420, partial [bacterium]